ncbi:type II toxin-antitoxin system VapC family toxin [Marinobacter sp.]|jgi:predicted nucleic acid-binding protein|uniref:type II toxin-antitoxin system VapC family toxin n=1 Tax=Marinobacter sp. TaxID=50741 RepID=UPI0019AC741D|nr:type II toxin-antitoxin system VapC family toxin [Marinobacter sp.]MBC7192806.1 type II toxin-antitoxin system VapC family toxin [Marinobacter sp.]
MSGKYLLDTNALIYAINRKLKLPKADYVVSVITKMELLSWPQLSEADEQKVRAVLSGITVLPLSSRIQESTIKIRRATSLKLPDSIISATAIDGGYVMVTDDEKLRNRHVGEAINLDALVRAGH